MSVLPNFDFFRVYRLELQHARLIQSTGKDATFPSYPSQKVEIVERHVDSMIRQLVDSTYER